MNHTKTIKAIAERSQVEAPTCEQVVKAYEKYGEQNITRTSRKHMAAIVEWISSETTIEPTTCEVVMNELFDLFAEETKKKIPFMK